VGAPSHRVVFIGVDSQIDDGVKRPAGSPLLELVHVFKEGFHNEPPKPHREVRRWVDEHVSGVEGLGGRILFVHLDVDARQQRVHFDGVDVAECILYFPDDDGGVVVQELVNHRVTLVGHDAGADTSPERRLDVVPLNTLIGFWSRTIHDQHGCAGCAHLLLEGSQQVELGLKLAFDGHLHPWRLEILRY